MGIYLCTFPLQRHRHSIIARPSERVYEMFDQKGAAPPPRSGIDMGPITPEAAPHRPLPRIT